MSSYLKKDLIWWREVPVDVEWGLLDFLVERWIGNIYIVCSRGFEEARANCGWTEQSNQKLNVLIEEQADTITNETIKSLYSKDAVHLFSGVRGMHQRHLDMVKKYRHSNAICILVAESPSLYGSRLKCSVKNFAYHLLYFSYYVKYGKMFSAFFTLGRKAKKMYSSYGWNEGVMFPFMYLPRFQQSFVDALPKKDIKFLYLGRFSDATKGVFLMKDAFAALSEYKNWHLDIVGGYGDQKDELIEWAHKTDHVDYLGKWDALQVCERMREYDVCIVPSRYDGWNMLPYQSLCVGIACIVSDNAGSDALVDRGKYGEVFQANDIDALIVVLKKAISNPRIVEQWKQNAKEYQNKINREAVGQYFLDCIAFASGEQQYKPACPWEQC